MFEGNTKFDATKRLSLHFNSLNLVSLSRTSSGAEKSVISITFAIELPRNGFSAIVANWEEKVKAFRRIDIFSFRWYNTVRGVD